MLNRFLLPAILLTTIHLPSFAASVDFYDGGTISTAVGTFPSSVATADLNGDGIPDAVVANFSSNDISVLIGKGDGTFATAVSYAAGTNPISIAIGDFNSDGIADVVAANSGSNNLSVFLGNGDGTLGAPSTVATGNHPLFVITSDFNRDGETDIAVANAAANSVYVLLGTGTGTFTAPITVNVGNPTALLAGDFNDDGIPDLAATDQFTGQISISLGVGGGAFGIPTYFNVGTRPSALAAADFNADGKTDLAVANAGSNNISILIGNGAGSFAAAVDYSAGTEPVSIVAADFNHDGAIDIAACNYSSNNASIFSNNGDGTFAAASTVALGTKPASITVAHFNRDGNADLIATDYFDNDIRVLPGDGAGSFAQPLAVSTGSNAVAIVTGDLNHDGQLDIAFVNQNGNKVGVALGTGRGTFGNSAYFAAGNSPTDAAAADFNHDGNLDLAITNGSGSNVSILLGAADGTFSAANNFSCGTNPNAIVIADFNNDGNEDLAIANVGSNNVSILIGNGDGTFQAPASIATGNAPTSIAAGDFDRDGKMDFITANALSNSLSVFLGKADGTFTAASGSPIATGISTLCYVMVGDFNSDGNPDIAYVIGDSVAVRLGDGLGSFGNASTFATGNSPQKLIAADFNGDGIPDLASANSASSDVSVLIGTGTGAFNPAVNFPTDDNSALVSADFNGDGKPDIIAGGAGMTNLRLLVNKTQTVKDQNIVFAAIPDKTFGDAPFTLNAVATSGLPVSYGVTGPATITENVLAITGAGSVTVTASQAGDSNYNPAANVVRSFNVAKADQTITFGSLSDKIFGDAPFVVSATSDSELAVSFGINGPATLNGNLVTITGAGQVTITASQAGDANYKPANSVSRSFNVAKADQTITFAQLSDRTFGEAPVALSASASSSLPVSFAIASGPGQISSGQVSATAPGTITVTATQSGNANFNAAPPVQQSFTVTNIAPVISSAPMAVPAAPLVGEQVSFYVAAQDTGTDTFSIAWNFGDGTATANGATVTHIFGAVDTYNVVVTVTDAMGAASSAFIPLTVAAGGGVVAATTDTDGDGFSDSIELAAGSSISNPSDTPLGGPANVKSPLPLADTKLSIKLNFSKAGSDAISLAGSVFISQNFNPANQKLLVDVGGVAKAFTLGAKGSVKTADGIAGLKSKGSSDRIGVIAVKLAKGDFAATLAGIGLVNSTTTANVSVPVTVILDGRVYQKSQAQTYSAKANKSGATKDTR